MPVSKKRTKK